MDEYEIAQLILNESLKVLDSYNLHTEFIFEWINSLSANVYRYCDDFGYEHEECSINILKAEAIDTSKLSRSGSLHAQNATALQKF